MNLLSALSELGHCAKAYLLELLIHGCTTGLSNVKREQACLSKYEASLRINDVNGRGQLSDNVMDIGYVDSKIDFGSDEPRRRVISTQISSN